MEYDMKKQDIHPGSTTSQVSLVSPHVTESRFWICEIFACGIQNLGKVWLWNNFRILGFGIQNHAQGIRNPPNEIQNPSSAEKESGIQCLESGIYGMESKI